jgi:DNA-directed RNA polymerase specialized sigma24 family protein
VWSNALSTRILGVPVEEEILDRAREDDREAIEQVITACYPAVHRIAHALTGEPKIAQRITRFVLRRAVTAIPRWRKGLIAENWFYHYTVLTTRLVTRRPPPAEQDLLITAGPATQPAFAAFVRAIRALHVQQMEAFILHVGEKLNERLLGVAMDLSTQAAAAHLAAATATLQTIAGGEFESLRASLDSAYMNLTPPQTIVRTASQSEIRSVFWRRLLRRAVRRLVWLAILAALGYVAWHWRVFLLQSARQWFEVIKSRAQSRPA